MKSNWSALAGIVGGFVLMIGAIYLTSNNPIIFVSVPSVIIVVGGTLTATMITYSFEEMRRAWVRFIRLLKPERVFGKSDLDHLIEVAAIIHRGQIKKVEEEIPKFSSPFIQSGLRMMVDGMKEDGLVSVMQWRMHQTEELERNDAAVFRTMATYSPAFGMAGTLIGLVNMLRMMGEGGSPTMIGLNMATALLTTFYGVFLANAVLKPISAKIEKKCFARMRLMGTILEAIRAMSQNRAPSYIREILYAIAVSHEEELGHRDTLEALTDQDLYDVR